MKTLIDWFFSRSESLNTASLQSVGLLILRVWVGFTLIYGHGWRKLVGYGDIVTRFPDPLHVGHHLSLGLVVFAEVFCSLFLIIGVFTRGVVIPLIIDMFVIVFVISAGNPYGKRELPLFFLMVYLVIFFAGPGRYSIDRLFASK